MPEYTSKTLQKALASAGVWVVALNPRLAKNIPGRETDMNDSLRLAQLGRFGLPRSSYVSPPEFARARHLSRLNQIITRDLAKSGNRVIKYLVKLGERLDFVARDVFGKSVRITLEAIIADETPIEAAKRVHARLKARRDEILRALATDPGDKGRAELRRLLERVVWRERRKANIEGELLDKLKPPFEILDRLETIPGSGGISAASIHAEMGPDVTAYETADKLSEWAGVRPGDNESAAKRMSGKTAPGDRWIRRTLCERAHAAARTPSHFARAFKGIRARRGYKRAVVAIARELLQTMFQTMFFLISKNDVYRDRVVDYAAPFLKKVLPRWVVALKNLGRLPSQPRVVPEEELKKRPPQTGLSSAEETPSTA
ncbi:MAG: transposase [Deltaproteobacteria bacterium]|jgi:hypothetical protein|nr:transposase [Deltaproteobacteria bacterium]